MNLSSSFEQMLHKVKVFSISCPPIVTKKASTCIKQPTSRIGKAYLAENRVLMENVQRDGTIAIGSDGCEGILVNPKAKTDDVNGQKGGYASN